MTEQESDKKPAPSPASRPGIDPKKVMEDALQAIANSADNVAGITPEPAPSEFAPTEAAPTESVPTGSAPCEGAPSEPRSPGRKRKRGGQGGASADRGDSERSGQRKTRKKRGSSATTHANDAVHALSGMVRNVLDSQKVHFLSRPRFMELTVRVPLDARADGARCAGGLVERVLELVAEVRDNDDALAPGAVYCYFSETAEAEVCRPEEPRHVFDGYGSTGRPKFTDFVTMAIERKSPGIDGLLGGEEITLTHVTQGRVLRTAQLAEFGKTSPVYRILGQVDAGLFAVRGQEAKAAFSFQVLMGKDLEGQPVLRLHPVGKCDVTNLVDHSVAQILQRFQGDLEEAALRLRGKQTNGDAPDEEDFVLPMLQDLAKKLEDRARHRSRRTEHADRRAEKSTRPTTKAYEDAQSVSDDALLWDDEENTIIVLGSHGRVHVFTPEAKHVTSVSMNRGTVHQRLKSHRWRDTEPGERGEFRMQLRALAKSHRERSQKRETKREAAPAPGQLQSKIAQLMTGLGGGAAKPPEDAAVPAPDAAPPGETDAAQATTAAASEEETAPTGAVEAEDKVSSDDASPGEAEAGTTANDSK